MELKIRRSQVRNWIDQAFAILGLLLFSRAFVSFFETEGGGTGRVLQLVYLLVYSVIAFYIVLRWKRFLYLALSDKLLLLLIGYVFVSFLWSAAPETTLRRTIVFAGATAFGIYLAARFDLRRQMQLLAWTLALAAVFSLALVLVRPGLAVESGIHSGAWQGIYGQKNALGRLMTLNAALFWLLIPIFGRRRWVAWGFIGLSIVLIWRSTSATSLVVLLGLMALRPFYLVLRQRDRRIVPPLVLGSLLIAVLIVALVLLNAEPLLALVGKNLTLSSRVPLWRDVLHEIAERPWLGYGYNGFWLGNAGQSADIWQAFGWHPDHAHNGFLDMALDLGLIGLGLVLIHLFLNFRRALALVDRTRTPERLWPLIYLVFLILTSLSYSILLSQYVFFWGLYVATTLSIRLELARIHAARRAQVTAANPEPILVMH
jgi:exopolysaccharide production protein ExoQ